MPCRWRISYWYGFIAQFTFLPFHQEYVDSGEILGSDGSMQHRPD